MNHIAKYCHISNFTYILDEYLLRDILILRNELEKVFRTYSILFYYCQPRVEGSTSISVNP